MSTSLGVAGAPNADTEIANRISNALIIRATNVKALSDETGIAYPTLRRSLKGGRSLTIQDILKIADAIGVQPSSLLPDTLTNRDAA